MEGEMNEEAEQIDEGGLFHYTGKVNGKSYGYTVRSHHDLTDDVVHKALKRGDNDHLEPHEIQAIVDSGGEEESHVNVTHNGKKYTHHVINDQEPRHMYEEFQQVDELKKSTLQSYAKKASKEMKKAYDYHQMRYGGRDGSDPEYMKKTYPWALAKMDRREAGVAKAKEKLTKEEVEHIDELKKSTLASYVNKAANQVRAKTGIAASFETSGSRKRDPENKAAYMDLARDYRKGAKKRLGGIEKATAKLAKEEVETVEEGAADWKKAFNKVARKNYEKDIAAPRARTYKMDPYAKKKDFTPADDDEENVKRDVRKMVPTVREEVRYFSGTTVSGKAWKFIPPGEPKMLSPEFVKDRVPTLTDKEAHEVSVVAKDQYNDVEKKFAEMSEAKGGTVPKTAKEKNLAAKAHPKHLITRKDVLRARGVKLGEEELREKMREKMFAGKTMTKKQADPVVFHPMGKMKQPQK
jgi:hypothetical protein